MKRHSIAAGLFAATLLSPTMAIAATKAAAAGDGLGGTGEVILLAEVALLLLMGRGLGELAQRAGQPAVIGQLLAGLILGPSLFGWVWPQVHDLIFPATTEQKNLIAGLSDLGVMMLLLLTGMETDIKLARRVGKPAVAVAVIGIAVPFACGFGLAQWLPSLFPDAHERLVAALFLGTALSISSIKIVAMVVREMNFMRRNLGQIIVAAAIIEDTVGWVIVSITLGIAGGGGATLTRLAMTLGGTIAFLVLSYTIGRSIVFRLIRWVNDTFVSDYAVVTAILVVMCLMALVTQAIGVNTVLGAFVAGVLVGQSPMLSEHIEDQLRGLITAFFMPIFFGLSGLSANLTILKDPVTIILTLGLIAIASLGKFGGAFVGGRISGLSRRECLALGCGMNARGSTEVIVATIGLTMGALTQNLYSMIVTMAIVTTMTMPPMLRWALRRLPISEDEKARLEKEKIDTRGFVTDFERLLIAADESANGKFATRIAGFIAGHRGIPLTVLKLDSSEGAEGRSATSDLEAVATQGAKEGHRAAQEEKGEERQDRVDISARVEPRHDHKAVTREADKGYDLLFIGVSRMRQKDGAFTRHVDKIATGFSGPLALALSGPSLKPDAHYRILVPVNGTEASRQGAEIAFALSPAKDTRVTALYVAERTAKPRRNSARVARVRMEAERAVLDDTKTLGGRYGHADVDTAVHSETAPEEAILEEAMRVGANLIVIGANRRVGDVLYFGQTVTQLLKTWSGAMVVVGI